MFVRSIFAKSVCSLMFLFLSVPETVQAGGHYSHPLRAFREQDNPAQAPRDLKIYQGVVSLRDHNPSRFDQTHAFYGKLLTSEPFFQSLVARWHLDRPRFEHWHPLLWRVLDGGVLAREATVPHQTPPLPLDGLGNPTGSSFHTPDAPSFTAPSPPPNSPPTQHSPPPASATPEPSTFVLLATGALFLILRAVTRRSPPAA